MSDLLLFDFSAADGVIITSKAGPLDNVALYASDIASCAFGTMVCANNVGDILIFVLSTYNSGGSCYLPWLFGSSLLTVTLGMLGALPPTVASNSTCVLDGSTSPANWVSLFKLAIVQLIRESYSNNGLQLGPSW
jgi:hypothetical protein